MKYILALDQGTTGSRAFLFDKKGKIVGSGYQEFKQYYPKPGWVEHDANEIWESMVKVIRQALRKAKAKPEHIVSIGITNQRETTVIWDRKTSKPVHKAIVWQCRRTSGLCNTAKWKKLEPSIRKKTGLVLDPYFSGTKVKWLLDNVKGLRKRAQKGSVAFGTIDAWIIWKLTGGASHVTDVTNASRTLLFNIKTLKWDASLLKTFRVPKNILPTVKKSGDEFGRTARVAGLKAGIPITGVLGDQQAALYGQGCYSPGTVKNTYGTGCFLVLNTGRKLVYSKNGLLTTIASDKQGNPVYALEGSIFIAGAVMQWLRDELKIIKDAPSSERMIKGLKDTNGVYVVPAFAGLGAPYWDSEARGVVCGLTRGANNLHIIRAALESMAYQTKDVFDLMQKEYGKKIKQLRVDGGACQNNMLMQFQSDVLRCHVLRPKMVDSTVAGVAHLAGLRIGFWKSKDLDRMHTMDRTFRSRMSVKDVAQKYDGWLEAVERSKS